MTGKHPLYMDASQLRHENESRPEQATKGAYKTSKPMVTPVSQAVGLKGICPSIFSDRPFVEATLNAAYRA